MKKRFPCTERLQGAGGQSSFRSISLVSFPSIWRRARQKQSRKQRAKQHGRRKNSSWQRQLCKSTTAHTRLALLSRFQMSAARGDGRAGRPICAATASEPHIQAQLTSRAALPLLLPPLLCSQSQLGRSSASGQMNGSQLAMLLMILLRRRKEKIEAYTDTHTQLISWCGRADYAHPARLRTRSSLGPGERSCGPRARREIFGRFGPPSGERMQRNRRLRHLRPPHHRRRRRRRRRCSLTLDKEMRRHGCNKGALKVLKRHSRPGCFLMPVWLSHWRGRAND
jgi:hypothetical protein